MMNRRKLLNKLEKQTRQLENQIEHRELYNIRNSIIKILIKSGITIDYALPFILSSIIIVSAQSANGNVPFKEDEITINEKASIETIDTSNGIHVEHISYDFDYNDEILEYSTGWIINDKGLYQRTVTSYGLENFDLSNIEKVLKMTKEEIENALIITNIKTIQKNTLSPEDDIYKDDALIVINHTLSEEETITRPETFGENALNSAISIVLSFGLGSTFKKIEKIFVKTYIRDRLKAYEPLFREINREELEEMKKILELKKENLALITPNGINEDSNYSYKLRRV